MTFTAADLARFNGEYQTVTTLTTFAAVGIQQLLKQDSRRWYVRFDQLGGASGISRPWPKADPVMLGGGIYVPNPVEFKWADCVSLVTGDWYGYFDGTTQWAIIEVIYVGG